MYSVDRNLVIWSRDNKSCRRYARGFLAPFLAPLSSVALKGPGSNCQQIFLKASAERQKKEEGLSEMDMARLRMQTKWIFFSLSLPSIEFSSTPFLIELNSCPSATVHGIDIFDSKIFIYILSSDSSFIDDIMIELRIFIYLWKIWNSINLMTLHWDTIVWINLLHFILDFILWSLKLYRI